MSDERWQRIQELFEAARHMPPGERDGLLTRECRGDHALRSEVESLLAAGDRPGATDSLAAWLEPLHRQALEQEAPRSVGPYEIVGSLGRGGMGVVYRAHDPRLGREVAVKVLHRDLAANREAAARFVAEARAASALDHPHVCTIHDLGRLDDGRLFLAMAYYSGGSLSARLAAGPVPLEEAVRITAEIASALERAHQAGIVHRDIKPDNIAFTADGATKILDFGVAKLAYAAGVTLPGTLLGTPRYMAPEQFVGDPIGPWTDVWALAAVLYEMLAGRPAFAGDELSELRQQILGGAVEPLAELRPELPEAVCSAVHQGLRLRSGERPPSATELAARLGGETTTVVELRPSGRRAALPEPLTSFVGREQELTELAGRLTTARWVTLTGPGGTGKTRLAIETARRLQEAGRHVRLVPLADLRDARLVPSTVARALGAQVGAAGDPLDAIAGALGDTALLLVLDNLEQLSEAAPWLSSLLSRCPGLTVLATSRGPLRISAEQELPVPPLPVAERFGETPAQGAENSPDLPPAVRLFFDRARAAAPGLQLDREEIAAVAEICRRLDGLPLAVELAAARVRLFPPRQLLGQLRERLDLPGSGPRDHPDRHRTLRSALAWSYELLQPENRHLFRTLSVFRGGFTLEQAASLADLEIPDLADGLDALLDQALLVRPDAVDGRARFRLLETVRAFAGEELSTAGEDREVRAAHGRLFLALAVEAAPHLEAGDQEQWLTRLDRDRDNLRAALDTLAAAGAPEPGLRLAVALWRYWLTRGDVAEGLEQLERLLETSVDDQSELRLRALLGAATLAHNAGHNPQARKLLDRARELSRHRQDDRAHLQVLNNLAWVACEMSDLPTADTLGTEALALARKLGDRRGEAVALNNLGFLAAYREDWEEAQRLHEESLALRRAVGDLRGEGFALINVAWSATRAGRLDEAERRLREALERVTPLGDRIFLAWARIQEAYWLDAAGKPEQACELLDSAAADWSSTGNLSLTAEGQALRGSLARRLGDAELAGDLLGRALAGWRACGTRLYEASTAWELGELARANGDRDEARRWWRESLRLAEEVGAPSAAERARISLRG